MPARRSAPIATISSEATFDDVRDALARPGCAVCRLAARRADRYLGSYLYEHVNDVELRAIIREARGFCERHAHDLLDKLDALAVAITYRDILNTLVRELGALSGTPNRRTGVWGRLRPWRRHRNNLRAPAVCPVCEAEATAAGRALDVLAHALREPAMVEALKDGDPLCLDHLRGVLARSVPSGALTARQERGWGRLRDRLRSVIEKSDHHRRFDQLTDEERTALRAGVEAVAGSRRRPDDDAPAQVRKLRRGGSNARRSTPRAESGAGGDPQSR